MWGLVLRGTETSQMGERAPQGFKGVPKKDRAGRNAGERVHPQKVNAYCVSLFNHISRPQMTCERFRGFGSTISCSISAGPILP